MFCKTSVQSFVYDLIDIFMFTDIIVKVLTKPKVIERLDLSDNFWEQFGVQNKN